MIIRPINVSDINDIVEIEILNYKEPWDYKTLYYESQINPNSEFWGVFNDALDLMGYLGFWKMDDYVDVTNISVKEEYKRSGVASFLMDELYKRAQSLDAVNIFLEVNVNNQAAINLYEKIGFKKVRRIKNYYSKLKEDAFLMQKEVKYD